MDRRFERFRSASGLSEKSAVVQVNALIYSMGDDADDILRSFGLSLRYGKTKVRVTLCEEKEHYIRTGEVQYEEARGPSLSQICMPWLSTVPMEIYT